LVVKFRKIFDGHKYLQSNKIPKLKIEFFSNQMYFLELFGKYLTNKNQSNILINIINQIYLTNFLDIPHSFPLEKSLSERQEVPQIAKLSFTIQLNIENLPSFTF
jgi:hypothetical protein